jgi:hypothetical protein
MSLDDKEIIFRAGADAVELPKECGKVLSICAYQGSIILACENGVWTYSPGTDEFRKVSHESLQVIQGFVFAGERLFQLRLIK